jgi:translation initiation factor 3 subunit H
MIHIDIDIQVVLKIIKHCQEEGSNEAQGVLLGLVVDKRLEITNCFPMPRSSEDDDMDESKLKRVYHAFDCIIT